MTENPNKEINTEETKEPKKKYGLVPAFIDELWMNGVKSEKIFRINSARVFFADYPLIRKHFPELNDQNLEKAYPGILDLPADKKEKAIKEKVDDWLLYYTAFMSETQVNQDKVNTPIDFSDDQSIAWRPPKYGRAMVYSLSQISKDLSTKHPVELEKEQLLDIKGCGLGPGIEPNYDVHGDGLLKLSDALVEYTNQKAIEGIFKHSKSYFKTVPIYAILDLGFEIKTQRDFKGRAALMIRQPHRRPHNPGGLPTYGSDEQKIQLEVELLLRKYGVTSVNNATTTMIYEDEGEFKIRYGGHAVKLLNEEQEKNIREVSRFNNKNEIKYFDGVNVQLTREIGKNPSRATLVDFGTYRVRGNFDNPILSLVSDKLMRWGGSIFPHFKEFTQPDQNYCVPVEIWGTVDRFWGYETELKTTRQDYLCEGLCADYKSGKLSADQVVGRLNSFIRTATSRWE